MISVRLSECPESASTIFFLGVYLRIVDKDVGVTWKDYQNALKNVGHGPYGHELAPCTRNF
jgi:hypothetical protein